MLRILLLGQNHETAPVELREQLAFTPQKQDRLGELLATAPSPVREGVVLSTCNRVELYAVCEEADAEADLGRVLESVHGVDLSQWRDTLYFMQEREAVRHLFNVASGLDSMVLGEGQILSQVREACEWAEERRLAREILPRVFQDAVACGKRVRSDTKVGEGAVSVAYAAVSLARKIFQDLSRQTVLLLGAGETGHRVARHFRLFGVNDLRVANRTAARAAALATEMNASMVPWSGLEEQLAQSAIVVCATAADRPLIDAAMVRRALDRSRRRASFFIDLSVPRDVDPLVADIPGVFLYNVDDLQKVVLDGEDQRKQEAVKAERIVDEQLDRFLVWYHSRDFAPTLRDLQSHVDELRGEELASLEQHLDPETFQEVERAVQRLTRRMLHDPLVGAKEWATEEDPQTVLQRFRRLFGLDRTDRRRR